MKFDELFKEIHYELIKGNKEIIINDICYKSKETKPGDIFVALNGTNDDGHNYINEAINRGAVAILLSKNKKISDDVLVVKVDNPRKIMTKLAMNLFNYPQSKLKTIAVTGTKGKTTTSFMIKKIIETANQSCGLIGTTGIYINKKYYENKNTTPEGYDIIKYMNEMVNQGIHYVVMEVSSQALKYDRVNDIIFDYGIFTNLTKDHISPQEHCDMQDYLESKSKLFKQCIYGIFNIDSQYFYEIVSKGSCEINTFGYNQKADLRAKNIKLINKPNFLGITFDIEGVINDNFIVSSPGKFSSYNAMAAILTCYLLNIDISFMKKALANFSVKGRVEPVKVSDDFILLIDYAHNGLSTKSILSTVKQYNPTRLITIFGCGGNRSKERRYEMGLIASNYSDKCIITEDNNRYEKFEDIAKDILRDFNNKCEYILIPDRKKAIKHAIENGKKGDIIMLLGKGHENYKEINGIRYPFDEREVIKDLLSELKKTN